MDFKNGVSKASLSITGYAYEVCGDRFEDNWLNVSIEYKINSTILVVEEACLLTFELHNLKEKIIKAERDTQISFTEGHLNFGISPKRSMFFLLPDFYLLPQVLDIPKKYELAYDRKSDLIENIDVWIRSYPIR